MLDYIASYFTYKIPIPVHKELINKSWKYLQIKSQANASSVEIDLGGENHEYLVLVLTDEQYKKIPNTETFVALLYQLPLIILSTVTLIEALNLKKDIRKERDCIWSARTLRKPYYNICKRLLRINILLP